jgi:benzoate/toluate 1,2-dioxygenase beta subunit
MENYQNIINFLYKETRHLDDKNWDEWLKFYDEDCIFWMPSWTDEDELTTNPQTEISLIYYSNKGGLEDRVFRIKTERSSASMPEPRTTHNINNVEILEENDNEVKIRFNWHTLSFSSNISTLLMLCVVLGSGIDAEERSVLIRKTRSSKPPLFE